MLHLRYLAVAGSLAAIIGPLSACGSAHSPSATAPAPGTGAGASSPAPSMGLLPAPRQLSDQLVLAHTSVTAGTPLKGTLIVTNHGGRPVNLTHGCRPAYAVVLTSHRFPPRVAFAADCSARPFIIKPGVNRLAVMVMTSYRGCTQDQKQATHSTPACLRGNRMPPLPEGRYRAVLVGDGNLRLPPPAPVQVLLTGP